MKQPYVIDYHEAHRAGIHFDFRIKYPHKDKLMSWALPKARFPEVGEKLLAVQTPDHEMDWLSWQGEIPKGEYGGGKVTIYQSGMLDIFIKFSK